VTASVRRPKGRAEPARSHSKSVTDDLEDHRLSHSKLDTASFAWLDLELLRLIFIISGHNQYRIGQCMFNFYYP